MKRLEVAVLPLKRDAIASQCNTPRFRHASQTIRSVPRPFTLLDEARHCEYSVLPKNTTQWADQGLNL